MTFETEASRAAFEKLHLGGNKQVARRNEHGYYVVPAVADAWAGWDAAFIEGARLRKALQHIERFGHNEGHGRGYTCATMAAEALGQKP